MNSGFSLLGVLIVTAVIVLLFFGLYARNFEEAASVLETGMDVEKDAQEVVRKMNDQFRKQEDQINRFREGMYFSATGTSL